VLLRARTGERATVRMQRSAPHLPPPTAHLLHGHKILPTDNGHEVILDVRGASAVRHSDVQAATVVPGAAVSTTAA